jgi:hypothetical protein
LENNSRPKIPRHFAKKPLYFSEINPQSVNFQLGPKFEKYLKRSLASEKSPKIAPKLQKFISF